MGGKEAKLLGPTAGRRPGEDDARLPAEPSDTTNVRDARHWQRVYAELVEGFREITRLATAEQKSKADAQLHKVEERLRFWERRLRELS